MVKRDGPLYILQDDTGYGLFEAGQKIREPRVVGAASPSSRTQRRAAVLDAVRGFYYVVLSGVRVFRMDEQGHEVEITRLGQGDVLAEAVMFAAKVYPAFAQDGRGSECLIFRKDRVLSRVEKDPRVARAFLLLLVQKCLALNAKIESLGLRTVRQRLAKPLSTANETLSRTPRQMSREELLEVRGRSVVIKDCVSLRAELGE